MRGALNGATPHKHNALAGDPHCPTCNSVISPELYEAIMGELAVHDAEVMHAAEARFEAREAAARREATATANAANADKLAKSEQARKTAEQAAKAAKTTAEAALREQRETLGEKAAQERDRAVNAVTEKYFGENLRLQERVLELQRMLEKKQPQERGNADEMDAFETLLVEFPLDQIARVAKGVNGADIAFRVFSNGVCVGCIAIECKSVRRFSHGWVGKLKEDMISMGASHGVLITPVFPPDEHQLVVKDGIIIAHPARAVAVLHILRRIVIAFHMLKLSQEERDEKMAALYRLMISDRAISRWERMSSATTELVDIERSDASHQEKVRNRTPYRWRTNSLLAENTRPRRRIGRSWVATAMKKNRQVANSCYPVRRRSFLRQNKGILMLCFPKVWIA